jgi:serine/threonine protein kinase
MPQPDIGVRQERFLGIGITGVVVQQGDKALKKLRRYDITKVSPTRRDELEWLMETSRWRMRNEMQVYKHLGDHDGIIQATFNDDIDATTPSEPVIVMPFMKNGDLQRYISRNEPDEHLQVRWVRSLATTLAFCHSKHVLVADIGSRNCLLADDLSLKL